MPYRLSLLTIVSAFIFYEMKGQCPVNIGFETGTFQNWECSAGEVNHNGVVNILAQGVLADRHVMIKNDGQNKLDPYGHFPVNCPNGSKYSIKLGNDNTGAQAERVSYTLVVPSNQSDYSILYDYAVVFQDPGHLPFQQPRFTAKVFDVASNNYIPCSSFDFGASANLPGFIQSDSLVNGIRRNVYYKPWSLASIKLSGYAGKTIRLEFTTNDCTEGEHFGYAYIDVNNDCQPLISGNTFCRGSQAVTLTAPFGYQKYYWYDAGLATLLDSTNILRITPVPASGTVYGLILGPYPGSGCSDTLFTTVKHADYFFNFNLPDTAKYCLPAIADLTSPSLTAGSSSGLSFSYFTDSSLTHYLPEPGAITVNGIYYVKAVDNNGCSDLKPVYVTIDASPDFTVIDPPVTYYPNKTDLTAASVIKTNLSGLYYSFWKDAAATVQLTNPSVVNIAGTYFIKAMNGAGCSVIKPVRVIISIPPPPNIFSPNNDGIHDLWEIPGLKENPQCDVYIFNRYGQIIFHSIGYNKPWDGKINGKRLPAGTYYYVIKVSAQLPLLSGYVDIIY